MTDLTALFLDYATWCHTFSDPMLMFLTVPTLVMVVLPASIATVGLAMERRTARNRRVEANVMRACGVR